LIKTTLAIWLLATEADWPEFGCIGPDGLLLKDKAERLIKDAYYDGYSNIRVIPPLLGDPNHSSDFQLTQTNYFPWLWGAGKFNLGAQNPVFYQNLTDLARICNKWHQRFRFALADDCHGKAEIGPWRCNHQDIHTWRDYNDYWWRYVDRVGLALSGLNYGLEIENEPTERDFHGGHKFEDFCLQTMAYLERKGMPLDTTGGEFMYPHHRSYKVFIDALGPEHRRNKLATMHEFGQKEWQWLRKKLLDFTEFIHGRKYVLSSDGLKPRRDEHMECNFWLPIFAEVLHQLSIMGSEVEVCPHSYPSDPTTFDIARHAGRGVIRAAGYPLPERPVDPVEPPEPEPIKPEPEPKPEEKEMQYTRLFGPWKIYKLFKKIPILYKEVRLAGWVGQLRKSKALSGASADAFVVGLLLCWPLWQGSKLLVKLLIKTIVNIF